MTRPTSSAWCAATCWRIEVSSKRRIRRRSCTGKKRYTTAPAAQAAISSLHHRKGYQGYMQVYRCSFCNGYHFGHPPRNLGGGHHR